MAQNHNQILFLMRTRQNKSHTDLMQLQCRMSLKKDKSHVTEPSLRSRSNWNISKPTPAFHPESLEHEPLQLIESRNREPFFTNQGFHSANDKCSIQLVIRKHVCLWWHLQPTSSLGSLPHIKTFLHYLRHFLSGTSFLGRTHSWFKLKPQEGSF